MTFVQSARRRSSPVRSPSRESDLGGRRSERASVRGLAFNKIGAVYVWLGLVVVFSIWVPDTFPTIGDGEAGPERERDHGAGGAVDHDPPRRARVRSVVRATR